MNIYAEEIVAHYEHPHNKGKMANASTSFHEYNPTCGDDITVYMSIKDGKVSDVKFDGSGCAISMASASMLTDEIKGKSLQEVEKLGPRPYRPDRHRSGTRAAEMRDTVAEKHQEGAVPLPAQGGG